MTRCRTLRAFTDASTGKLVSEGREFECPPEAAAKLVVSGVAEILEPERPRPARSRARKKRK